MSCSYWYTYKGKPSVLVQESRDPAPQPLWNKVWQFLKKTKHRITDDLAVLLPGMNPKQLKARTQKDKCTPMFMAASFIIVKKVETTQDMPFTGKWIDKLWCTHSMERDPTLQKTEVLTHAIMWEDLENVMPSEIRQIKKDKFCTIPLYQVPKNRQVYRHKVEWIGIRDESFV